jgi:hypothetical protein
MPVFSTEPGGIQKIQTSARYGWSFNKIWFGPDCPDYEGIRKFIPGDTSFLFNPSDMLFVHRRSQPNGESRLVAITVEGGPWSASYPGATSTGGPVRGGQFVDYAGIESQVLIPEKTTYKWANRWANHRRIVQLILPRGCALTIEDGSPDQTDATRFTIPYTLGTQRGTMAGKLQPDDSILLQVRTGPLVLFLPDAPYVPIQRAPK